MAAVIGLVLGLWVDGPSLIVAFDYAEAIILQGCENPGIKEEMKAADVITLLNHLEHINLL